MDPDAVQLVALASGAVAVLALLLALGLLVRLRRLVRAHRVVVGDTPATTVLEAVERVHGGTAALAEEVARLRAKAATTLRHVAVVRYDAFGDLGGRQSFSAALLDDAGDGLVLTSITGRNDSRTYCKGVTGGGSEHPLSPEEKDAVTKARG